ncbi:MAG: cysteine--tRNA ligase, partial [Thalassovita sp.]
VLWKPSSDDLPGWDSPWGGGRGGWQSEWCAMSYELLGASFDIHGGGNDLMFPHHENEVAQSCCAHPEGGFANVWMHNEMLQVEGKKMSKSLGNFFTVRDLLDGHDGQAGVPGEVVRFVFLSTHYRKPMDWTAEKAEGARKELAKWRVQTKGVEPTSVDPQILEFLSYDLATADAITILRSISNNISNIEKFENGDGVSSLESGELARTSEEWRGILKASAQLMGLLTDDLDTWEYDAQGASQIALRPYAQRLFNLRAEAMQTKNFEPVDALKSALIAAGVEVRMSKEGIELVPGAGFDAAKLEGLL